MWNKNLTWFSQQLTTEAAGTSLIITVSPEVRSFNKYVQKWLHPLEKWEYIHNSDTALSLMFTPQKVFYFRKNFDQHVLLSRLFYSWNTCQSLLNKLCNCDTDADFHRWYQQIWAELMWADAPAGLINRSSSNKLNTLHTFYLITFYQLTALVYELFDNISIAAVNKPNEWMKVFSVKRMETLNKLH